MEHPNVFAVDTLSVHELLIRRWPEFALHFQALPGLVRSRHPDGISAALKPRFTRLVKVICLRPEGRSVSEKGTGPMLLHQHSRKSSMAEGSSKVSEACRPKPNMLLHKLSPGHRRVIYLT